MKHHLSEWIAQLKPKAQARFKKEFAQLQEILTAADDATPQALKDVQRESHGFRWSAWTDVSSHEMALAALELALVCQESHPAEVPLLCAVIKSVLKATVPIQDDELQRLLELLAELPPMDPKVAPYDEVVVQVERMFPGQPAPAKWHSLLQRIHDAVDKSTPKKTKTITKLLERITQLGSDGVSSRMKPDEGWADMLRQDLSEMPKLARQAWERLFGCASSITPQHPAKQWDVDAGQITISILDDPDEFREEFLKRFFARDAAKSWKESMQEHIDAVGEIEFATYRLKWFQAVPESKPGGLSQFSVNREVLRGLYWTCEGTDDPELVRAMRIAAAFHFRKNSPLGRTCVRLLAFAPAPNCLDELTYLVNEVKSQSQSELIEGARSRVAELTGVPAADLTDRPLPTSGFQELGQRNETLSDFRAELVVTESGGVELRWFKPDGKPQKSLPVKVKNGHGAELRDLKASVKEVKSTLATARERLELAPVEQRTWSIEDWRERYFDHPVVGTIARRLIWQFEHNDKATVAAWNGKSLVGANGKTVKPEGSARVSVWHPINATVKEVLAWREWLHEHEVRQPFKQAHREVYLLTDAERETEYYSNRFAAHILKQSQFRALAKTRGWKANYLGGWDGGYDGRAERELPEWELRAEFWTAPAGDDHVPNGGYLYLSTDQVRFYHKDARDPLTLSEVPPLPFSEIMRDVDLFIGVCSLGNDPNWHDGQHTAYWESYSFGELSESAKTRRAVLERIIPRLNIADRCMFSDRFLVVRGDIRTYRIHLGSSNILMEPNDQYLCIVSAQPAPDLFLPFEGDQRLSAILSKALMLADDTSITDRTITGQIGKKRRSRRQAGG